MLRWGCPGISMWLKWLYTLYTWYVSYSVTIKIESSINTIIWMSLMKSQLNIFLFLFTAFYSLLTNSFLLPKKICYFSHQHDGWHLLGWPLAPSSKALLCRNGRQADALLSILQKFKNMSGCRRGHQILTIKAGTVFRSLTLMLSVFLFLTTNRCVCVCILILKMSIFIVF